MRRIVRHPLTWLLAAWAASRLLLVLFCIEGVRFHPEETYIGAAASLWRRHPEFLPPHAYQYTPYEGGSIWVNTITAAFQALLGENLHSLKATPLLLGAFGVAAVWRFVDWLSGRAAAGIAAGLMILAPANALVEELKNDGLHYDATGFLFVGVLAVGLLTAATPTARRLVVTGLVLGVGLSFSYQCAPAYAAALLAWVLARDRGPGSVRERVGRLAGHAALLGLGALVGIAPHVAARAALQRGLFGLYSGDGSGGLPPLQAWRVPQRFVEVLWLNPYHEAPYLRDDLPLTIVDVGWVATIVLGSLAILAALRRRDFLECLGGLVPWSDRRASVVAAFGAPWLVLYPFAYTIATDANPPSFPWHYYPLYPVLAAALGLLGAELLRGRGEGRARAALLGLVALAWLPLLAAHVAGVAVPAGKRGPASLAMSRGASDIHLARFLVWNWIPRADRPEDIRDRILTLDADLRPELLAALGRSMRGHVPEHFERPLRGWDLAAFHRGVAIGRLHPLVETPSAPHRWPLPDLEAHASLRPCARAGTRMGEGALAAMGTSSEPPAGDAAAWWWFGRGVELGAKLDKDRTNAIFQGRPGRYGAVAERAAKAGPHGDAYLRGVGYGLGRGGVLVQHRALADAVDGDALGRIFEGIAMVRRSHFVAETRAIAATHFGAPAAAGFDRGGARSEHLLRCDGASPGLR